MPLSMATLFIPHGLIISFPASSLLTLFVTWAVAGRGEQFIAHCTIVLLRVPLPCSCFVPHVHAVSAWAVATTGLSVLCSRGIVMIIAQRELAMRCGLLLGSLRCRPFLPGFPNVRRFLQQVPPYPWALMVVFAALAASGQV